jgi:Tfp pilus assembly protein PilN
MIKINLLKDQTSRPRKAILGPSVSRTGLIAAAVFILLVGGITGSWFYVSRQVHNLTLSRNRLKAEDARLQELKKQIEQYDKLKRLRQTRIEVIEKLKDNQTGPVQLLNGVIHSMPGDGSLWLNLLNQKGDRTQIVGFTLRNESVADFMANLSLTGLFKSVDLELIESQKDASKFSVVCVNGKREVE